MASCRECSTRLYGPLAHDRKRGKRQFCLIWHPPRASCCVGPTSRQCTGPPAKYMEATARAVRPSPFGFSAGIHSIRLALNFYLAGGYTIAHDITTENRFNQWPCFAGHVSACFSLFQLILSHITLLNQQKPAGFSTSRTSPVLP
jgi:hypothetical protein